MKPNALVLALISAATALPGTANAADDICSRLIIYAISQFCQMLPNGQNLCQPIGLARPDPNCSSPSNNQVVQIPLGPPTIQAWPYAQFPALPNTFVPNAFTPNPLAANAFTPNAFAPNPFAANAFIPKEFAGNPYLAYLAGQSPITQIPSPAQPVAPVPVPMIAANAPDSVPSKAPVAPPVEAPPVVIASKPETSVEAAPITIVTAQIDKLMPESKPEAKPESSPTVDAKTVAPTPVEQPAAVVSTVVAAQPEAPAAQQQAIVEVKPVAQPAAPATVEVAPTIPAPVALASLPSATIAATTPASPVELDAVKQAELARVEAEKARQDALAHFEFDSAELTPVGRAMLDDWLKQASTNDPILVTGHADRLGPEPYNEKLSLLRAEAVKKYLIEKGKPAKRIVIQAMGEKFPLISCSGAPTDATIACLAPNRRAEIVFKPSVRKAARTATKLVKPKSRR